jgi:hypothetical protein
MPNEEVTEKPKAGVADAGHLAVRMALSAIPVVGGAAKELFNSIIAPPLAKRQAEWMESIAERLEMLEKQVAGFKIESLSSNENFISTVFYATTLNIRNHQEEKIEALQNAVLNTALNIAIEEDLEHIFLNFIDELTPSHLKVLKYFESPEEWFKLKDKDISGYYMGAAIDVFFDAFPELAKNTDFARQIINDLSARGLSNNLESMQVMTSLGSMIGPKITPLGKLFLNFITSPIA